jgi:probable nitrogen fixation protein
MSQTLTLNQPTKSSELEHPFLQELIRQIRNSDTANSYCNWSDEFLINQLIISSEQKKDIFVAPLKQLLTNAFYRAIGVTIEKKTGHPTETFIHLKDKELSSAVICCGRVLVLTSLMSGYLSFGFLSLQQLIELAESNVGNAVIKASQYLDFVC